MELNNRDSRSENKSSNKVVSDFKTADFVKQHKKSLSIGLSVIGVLAIVSTVLSLNYSGSASKLSRQERKLLKIVLINLKQLTFYLKVLCLDGCPVTRWWLVSELRSITRSLIKQQETKNVTLAINIFRRVWCCPEPSRSCYNNWWWLGQHR